MRDYKDTSKFLSPLGYTNLLRGSLLTYMPYDPGHYYQITTPLQMPHHLPLSRIISPLIRLISSLIFLVFPLIRLVCPPDPDLLPPEPEQVAPVS
jgi:hypothetical protein